MLDQIKSLEVTLFEWQEKIDKYETLLEEKDIPEIRAHLIDCYLEKISLLIKIRKLENGGH